MILHRGKAELLAKFKLLKKGSARFGLMCPKVILSAKDKAKKRARAKVELRRVIRGDINI